MRWASSSIRLEDEPSGCRTWTDTPSRNSRYTQVMRILKATKRRRCVDAQGLARSLTELGIGARQAIISEANEALIKGRVPQGRQQNAVVDVEALHVVAFRPGHNVRSAEQPGLGDSGERAAPPQ